MANWRPINDALGMSRSKRRARAGWFRRLPRTSFLFVEDMQANVVRAIRASGMRIDTVPEIGLRGHSDDDVFAAGWRRQQMVVTRDRDFWDDDRHPLRSCAGTLRLPDISRDLRFFWSIVTGPLRIFARGRDLWFHTKIRVISERMIVVKMWDRETGAIRTTRYWLRPNGSILVWG
jgi:predicted nuclease of predicted toxin-antitoxin system